MANVVSSEVGADIYFESLVIGTEKITHVYYGIGLIFEPIDKTLVKSRRASQLSGNIALAKRKDYH